MEFKTDEIQAIGRIVERTIFDMIDDQSTRTNEKDIERIGKNIKKRQVLHTKIMDWYHEELVKAEKIKGGR